MITLLHLVLIRPPLTFCVLFIKNEEIGENWSKSDNDSEDTGPNGLWVRMEYGKSTDQGVRSQVMLLTGCEILTKQVFFFGGENRPRWVEARREVLGLWLGYNKGGFLSPHLTYQAKFYTLEIPLTFANYTNSFPWEIIGA